MTEQSFEEISFRNIVNFYKPELLRVEGGERASRIFGSRCARVKLLKKNVLVITPCTSGKRLAVSEEAKTVLHTPP